MSDVLAALVEQLQRSAEGGAWHGPSLREALDGVTATDAGRYPIDGAHSIWELVLHLGGAYQLVLRRLDGDDRQLSAEEDWPVVPAPTEVEWRRDVDDLFAINLRMREAIARFPLARLFEPLVAEPPYTAFTQFIGLTQHDLYHVGQIALLRRAMREQDGAL